jgi:hypothetical protein
MPAAAAPLKRFTTQLDVLIEGSSGTRLAVAPFGCSRNGWRTVKSKSGIHDVPVCACPFNVSTMCPGSSAIDAALSVIEYVTLNVWKRVSTLTVTGAICCERIESSVGWKVVCTNSAPTATAKSSDPLSTTVFTPAGLAEPVRRRSIIASAGWPPDSVLNEMAVTFCGSVAFVGSTLVRTALRTNRSMAAMSAALKG